MSDIHINREVLQDATAGHNEAANYLRGVTSTNEQIQAALDSLGPVYAELREEGRATLAKRAQSYANQADAHEETAIGLNKADQIWEGQEADADQRFRALRGDA